MFVCRVCKFECVLDDVQIPLGNGECVCLRCYLRETGHKEKPGRQAAKDAGEAANGLS